METLLIINMSFIFWLLRKLFMSCKAGAYVHNFIVYFADKHFSPVRFGRSVPDMPEARKIAHNGRWKSATTTEFVRKNFTLDPRVRRRMIDNLMVWRSFVGYFRRRKWTKKGFLVPSNIYFSPTYRCNLRCQGCYAACHKHQEELSLDEIKKIADEQEKLGIFHMVMLGGEPFVREDLWQIYTEHPTTIFEIFTNGTLISEREVERIAELGNIRLFISMEGFRETTDLRRGKGVYDRVIQTLRLCQQKKIYFNVSVTVGKENFDEVTSDAFLDLLNGFGIFAINYVPYMSCGEDNEPFSGLTDEQVAKLELLGEHIQDRYPIFPIIGRNGSSFVTSCPAADGKIHITAKGDVEPCAFCHYAADNIRDKTILEVMDSPFFRGIRLFNNAGISRFNPCKVRKSIFLREEYRRTGAHSTITVNGK